MWVCIILWIGLFFFASISNETYEMVKVAKNRLTHHPLYSIMTFHTNIQTKLSRVALLFLRFMSGMFFMSIFNRAISSAHTAILIILVPFGAAIYAWLIGLFAAYGLKRLEDEYLIYLNQLKIEKD